MLACTLGLVTIAQKLPVELNCSCVVDFISIFIDNIFVFIFLLWFSCLFLHCSNLQTQVLLLYRTVAHDKILSE